MIIVTFLLIYSKKNNGCKVITSQTIPKKIVTIKTIPITIIKTKLPKFNKCNSHTTLSTLTSKVSLTHTTQNKKVKLPPHSNPPANIQIVNFKSEDGSGPIP